MPTHLILFIVLALVLGVVAFSTPRPPPTETRDARRGKDWNDEK